jgi:hypothetical protein
MGKISSVARLRKPLGNPRNQDKEAQRQTQVCYVYSLLRSRLAKRAIATSCVGGRKLTIFPYVMIDLPAGEPWVSRMLSIHVTQRDDASLAFRGGIEVDRHRHAQRSFRCGFSTVDVFFARAVVGLKFAFRTIGWLAVGSI